MKKSNAYNIQFAQLSFKKHHFEYKIDNHFLAKFEQEILKNIDISVKLELLKGDALTKLKFSFRGNITLVCDRSLEEYISSLNFERQLFLKYGEEYEEVDDELIQIPSNFQELDISHFIFEFIILQIPSKRLHPKFKNEEDFFFSTESEKQNNKKDNIDPRWDDLKKIKNKKLD